MITRAIISVFQALLKNCILKESITDCVFTPQDKG